MRAEKRISSTLPLLAMLFAGLLAPVLLGAQPAASGQSLPAPSRLRAAAEGSTVRLTWVDAASGSSAYAVYRSAEPFAAGSLEKAEKVATVASGIGAFADSPPTGKWYYAVLALDALARPYEVYQKMGTVTGVGIAVVAAPATPPAASEAAAAPPAEPETAAASPAEPPASPAVPTASPSSTVVAPASVPPAMVEPATTTQEAARKTEPATVSVEPESQAQAEAAEPEAKPQTAQAAEVKAEEAVKAEPVAGVAAPLPGKDIGAASMAQASGSATTQASPPASPLPPVLVTPPREAPLPFYLFGSSLGGSGGGTRQEAGLPPSPELSKAIATLAGGLSASASPDRPKPGLAGQASGQDPEEGSLVARDEVDSYLLDAMEGGDWPKAKASFVLYLATGGHGAEAEARARLYLGISLVELGKPEDALFEFAKASAVYPRDSKPWIDYALDEMRRAP